jgi:hypothetical protein
MAKVRQGCTNLFTKVAPGIEADSGTKLCPGIALPHVTLPTTEVRPPRRRSGAGCARGPPPANAAVSPAARSGINTKKSRTEWHMQRSPR